MICCAGQGRLANFSRRKLLWSLRTTAGARSVGWKRLSHPTTPGLVKTISANVAIRCHDTEHSWRFLTRSRRRGKRWRRSEEHTSELQSRFDLVCRLLLEKKKI